MREATPGPGSALLGRERELSELERGLDRTAAGRGHLFLLVGEPGIGKTRLADEISARAAARGFAVAWGRCWEAGGAPAYWPWSQALGNLVPGLDEPTLARAMSGPGATVAHLVPELRGRFPDVPPIPDLRSEEARFYLGQAVSAFLRECSARAPVLLVLDDLHAADPSSLFLLRFVARLLRSLRLLLVGTYRDVEARLTPAVGQALSEVEREGEGLHLRRLDAAEVARFVGDALGQVPDSLRRSIAEATQGNPLFLAELTRLLAIERPAPAQREAPALPLPYGVREAIRRRLTHLSAAARWLLDRAATIGVEFDLGLLASVAEQPLVEVLALLDEARAAGIVRERDTAGRAFSHGLVREAIYRDLPTSSRLALHRAVAWALERGRGGAAEPPLAELANHLLEAQPGADLEKAVDYALRAAQQASDLLAFEEAAALLERALAVLDLVPSSVRLRFEVLLALGEARVRAGRAGQASCLEAAELARRLGDSSGLARAALAYGSEFTFAMVDPALVSLLEEALGVLDPRDSPLRARLMARLAAALQPAADPAGPIAMARQAIEMGRRLNDEPTLLAVVHFANSALADYVEPAERLVLDREQAVLARHLGDGPRAYRASLRMWFDHVELGELAAAQAVIEELSRQAAALGQPRYEWPIVLARGLLAALSGRFAEAADALSRAQALGSRQPDRNLEPALLGFRLGLLRLQRADDEAARFLSHLVESMRPFPLAAEWGEIMSGCIRARVGDVESARAHLERFDWSEAQIERFGRETAAMGFLAETAVTVGHRTIAEQLYTKVLPVADRILTLGASTFHAEAPMHRCLGMLAGLLGRWDEAEGHFEQALGWIERVGARPQRAQLGVDWAQVLLRRGRPQDRQRAGGLIAPARAEAEALSMPGLLSQAAALVAAPELQAAASPAAAPGPATGDDPAPASATPAAGGTTPGVPVQPDFALVREGEVYTIDCPEGRFHLKNSKGLRLLERLLAHPGEEIHAVDLAAGPGRRGAGGAVRDEGAGPALDAEAKAAYRRRVAELREELEEAQAFNDPGRAERAQAELEWLTAELSRAVGLGGRDRKTGSAAERARVAVQRRLRDAVERIREHAPSLAQHLDWALHTGTFCGYWPEGRRAGR